MFVVRQPPFHLTCKVFKIQQDVFRIFPFKNEIDLQLRSNQTAALPVYEAKWVLFKTM